MEDRDVENDSWFNYLKFQRFYGQRGEDYALWRFRLWAIDSVNGIWSVIYQSVSSIDSSQSTDVISMRNMKLIEKQ